MPVKGRGGSSPLIRTEINPDFKEMISKLCLDLKAGLSSSKLFLSVNEGGGVARLAVGENL